MSKNMVKLFVKLRNATFTPLEVQFSKKYFFPPKRTPLSSQMQNLLKLVKKIWRRIKDLKNQGPYKSKVCKKLVVALLFRVNGLAITFTGPNEP